jgi:heterodisulfide reductase subunit A-like polyferredoxin
MTSVVATNQTILVVGGGISGMTAALEAAETGKQVVLVEKNPYLGGRTVQLYRYFPKMCHPTCGLEINLRRLKANPRIQVLTMAEVTGITGNKGAYSVSVKLEAALRQRELHRLRRMRQGGRPPKSTTPSTTTWARSRRPTCRPTWPTRSAM